MQYKIITFLIFFSLAGPAFSMSDPFDDKKITCEEMRSFPEIIFKPEIDLGGGAAYPFEISSDCEESLLNQIFLKRFRELGEKIRGEIKTSNLNCWGTFLPALERYYQFELLKAGIAPDIFLEQAEGKRTYEDVMEYFERWSLESIYNFDLHETYMSEYKRVRPLLESHYKKKFQFSEEKARNVAHHALMVFISKAAGSFPISAVEIPKTELMKVVQDKNSAITAYEKALKEEMFPHNFDSALKAALLYARSSKVISLLAEKANLNSGDESSLFFALRDYGNTEYLLKNGALVNYENGFGKTPLFYAIDFNDHKIVELLLRHGANVNHRYKSAEDLKEDCRYIINHTQRTPLMHAAQHSDAKMLKILIKRGAKYSEVDEMEFNALDYAIMGGKLENQEYLKAIGLKEKRH